MSQNIYKKDRLENIKLFSDIEYPKGYSNWTSNLDRAFGEQSYSTFYKELINPKKHKCNSFVQLFERENSPKQKYKNTDETFNVEKFTKSLKIMKIKEKERKDKVKNHFFERFRNNTSLKKDYHTKHALKRLKPTFPKVPEIGRYNPSYDIITKHSYQARFGDKETEKLLEKEKEKDKNFIEDYKNSKKIIHKNIARKMKKLKPKSKTIGKTFIERNNNDYNSNSSFSKTFTGNNHCLKFEVYTSRKPLSKGIL